MAINHLLSDFITRINVAQKCHYSYIYINCSNLLLNLVSLFYYNGIIRGYFICSYFYDNKDRKYLRIKYLKKVITNFKVRIFIKYTTNKYFYCHIVNVSKPGDRRFFTLKSLSLKTHNRNRYKTLYLSTSAGIITDDIAFMLKRTSGEGLLQLQI